MMSGMTTIPRSVRISSASGVTGWFAASTTAFARDLLGVAGVDHAAERGRDQPVDVEKQKVVVG